MLNKLFGKLSGQSKKKGFTMTELLTVVGIIAIVCAIAIPAIISISRSLAFKQANEYAESIFMAAQANLTEMKSDGRLIDLFVEDNGAKKVDENAVNTGFPNDEIHREQYMYASSSDGVYDVLLPATSIDSDARDGNVLIEYNPYTGNVYSVFYKDGGDPLGYTEGDGVTKVTRNEEERRDLKLGYYCGSALSATPLTPEETEASIGFINGEEFIVKVIIPIPQSYKAKQVDFENGLEVDLTVTGSTSTVKNRYGTTGENGNGSGSFTTCIKRQLDNSACKISEDGKSVIVSYTLDSLVDNLKDGYSFANYGRLDGDVSPASDATFAKVAPMSATRKPECLKTHLVNFNDEFNIYPGENVSIEAKINFQSSSNKNSVEISSDTLANVNPMFDVLMKGKNGGWVISVSNGRNLQNLNALSATIAKDVKSVSFSEDIDWKNTVTYYKEKYKGINFDVKTDFPEAPARALPYFVPIHNENLFGTARFVYPSNDNTLWVKIKQFLKEFFGIEVDLDSDVPTLTDDFDRVMSNGKYTSTPNTHATIYGGGHKVLNLDIDSSKYALGKNFYAGNTYSANRDKFTGLFGYVNTTIDRLSVVNPTIKGSGFDGDNNPATGVLVGATGFNSLITNCSAYIDTTANGFNRTLLPGGVTKQPAYNTDQKSYGVKGSGAVGGLVGYAKSHRTVTEELTNDQKSLAFSNCFAAVPVSGHMRGTDVTGASGKHYGYTNGVGGLVGNAEISNFYNCYASGDVKADGVYVGQLPDVTGIVSSIKDFFADFVGEDSAIDLLYNGRTSMGTGGFVGTSHGVRYTNCFAAGDVVGTSSNSNDSLKKKGTAGFVGIMSYEETHAYGNDVNSIKDKDHTDIAQMTVFQNCYAAGMAKSNVSGTAYNTENFSGANCRIKFDGFGGTATKYWAGNYYQVYAPWWFGTKGTVVKGIERLPYESFIFKDSYYISQYVTGDSDQTNACALPVTYAYLMDLTTMQNDPNWINDQIKIIQGNSVSNIVHSLRELLGIEDGNKDDSKYSYGGIYFGKWINEEIEVNRIFNEDYKGPRYAAPSSIFHWTGGATARRILDGGTDGLKDFPSCVRIKGVGDKNNYRAYYQNTLGSLEEIYTKLYKEGFSSDYWQAGGQGNTHAYDQAATGKYPFTKLSGLDYYGRWPAMKIACGLAYYEQYGADEYGYYFDRDGTSTLQDKPVISDGYAILTSAKNDKISVKINGNTYTINNVDGQYTATYTTENSVYYVHRLPWEALQQASSDSFYTKIEVTVNGEKTYTLYFNPNVALSQVNPVDKDGTGSNTKADEPTTLPAQVYIRSARQLAALGKTEMNAYTANENIKFVQQLDIDASKYTGESYANSTTVANAVKNNTSVASFNASYTGMTASEKSPIISGFSKPIFTVIGKTGSVSDLILSCGGECGSNETEAAGLLAGTNNGTVTNVDVKITTATTVSASKSAGLLIGVNSGTVSNCDATVSANATVKAAENAGGLIGINSGKVENCTAKITGTMTVKSKNAGGIVGMAMPGSIFNNVEVSGENLTGSKSLGAFAGTLDTANVSNVTVNINGEVTAENTAAGLAAVVTSGKLSNITVSVAEDAYINAPTAAGLIGTASDADIDALKLELKGKITGKESAVGAISDITGGSTSNVRVLLSGENAAITAPNNAAGFTLDADSNIENSYVIGKGTIEANPTDGNAAGFAVNIKAAENARVFNCFVSPADHTKTDLATAYKDAGKDAGLARLKINGANAAGFAVNVSGVIENSTALGKINGTNAAGFAVNVDRGVITGCMANTDNNGKAFALNNNGFVSNSYAWYKNGTADEIAKDDNNKTQHYYACYFAPLSSAPVTVVKGNTVCSMTYDELADLPLDELCPISDVDAPVVGNIWKLAGKDSAYPFNEMRPSNYAYPMLREHYGDWVNPTQYSYGIVYYEKYDDDSIGMNLKDVSFIGETDSREPYSLNTLADDSKTITETGYALFFHNHKQIKDITLDDGKYINEYTELTVNPGDLAKLELGGEPCTDAEKTSFLEKYEFRIIPGTQKAEKTEAVMIYGLDDGVHMFVPAFANEITQNWKAPDKDAKATYKIRTAAQFGNINKSLGEEAAPAEGFNQTHSFTMSTAVTLDNFKGLKYTAKSDNDVVHSITVGENVELPHGIFGAVSENSEISDVIVTDAKLKATTTAGILADTVDENSKVTDVKIVDPQIAISVPDYKTGSTVAVGAVAGQSLGNISNVSITMSQLEDADGNAVKDEDDKPVYKTFVIDASATKLIEGTLNLYVGGLVGTNNKTVSGSMTGDISYIPATANGGEGSINALMSFGGLVGTNNKTVSGSMTGDISFGSIALSADDKVVTLTDNIKLGGLVGHSTVAEASVSGTVIGNISYTRPAVITNNDNATSTGKKVTDNVMLGGLVGESNSGSVTGTFDGKAKKTNETDKTIAIVKAQNIIVDETDTSNNTYVLNTSVSGTTYIGGLVGKMNDGSFGNTVSASGAVKLDYSVGESYTGGIAGYVDNSVAVNNANTNLDITVSTANAELYAGGLVGRMNGNTLSGSASGTIKVTGSATNAYIGGAVGNTDGVSVTNVTSNSNINVDLGNGTRYVGGLVGRMNGGSMNGGTASGTLSINGSIDSAKTFVGGAIGEQLGSADSNIISDVTAKVDINGNWSKTNHDNSVDCPSGYANVGKFVGHVTGGKFTDCHGLGNSDRNLRLQFLGSIHKTSDTVIGNIYTSSVLSDAMGGSVTSLNSGSFDFIGAADGNKTAGFNKATDGTYYKFTASLNNCTYKSSNDNKEYTQSIEKTDYFYTYDKEVAHIQYKTGESVVKMENGEQYVIVSCLNEKALTTDGEAVKTTTFNKVFEDDTSTLWKFEGGINLNRVDSNRYLYVKRGFAQNEVKAYSNRKNCVIKAVGDGTDTVRFYGGEFWGSDWYMYDWYMYINNKGAAIETTTDTDDKTKFMVYKVISTPFVKGTMTYNAVNRVCTSNEP